MRFVLRLGLLLVAGLAALVVAAGCGSDSDNDSDNGGGDGPVAIAVGVPPFADAAPLHLGIEKGFFEAEGLDVRAVPAQSGAALLPLVVKGELQFGMSNPGSLLLAQAQGLEIKLVLPAGTSSGGDPDQSWTAFTVAKDSDIRSPQDLTGKTIGVNGLRSVAEVVAREALKNVGVDPESVELVEIPLPEMPAAMSSGRIDAAGTGEPFVTLAKVQGHRALFDAFEEVSPRFPISAWFTTREYAEAEPDVVARFERALRRSQAYAASHDDEVRRIIPTFTEIPARLAAAISLPSWGTEVDTEQLELIARLMRDYGLLEADVDVRTITE